MRNEFMQKERQNPDRWEKAYNIFDPLKPLVTSKDLRMYIERKGGFAKKLAGNIRKSGRPLKIVVSGQGGSGKSTEIAKTAEFLGKDYFTALLDVTQLFDIHNVNYVEILVGITRYSL